MTTKTPFTKPAPKSVPSAAPKGNPPQAIPHFRPVSAPGKPRAKAIETQGGNLGTVQPAGGGPVTVR